MKKIHVVALFAVFAFSLVAAASAFAGEWLVDGAAVTATLTVDIEGLLLLEDSGLGAVVDCEATLDGTIGPGGVDEITELLVGGVSTNLVICKPTVLCEAGMNVHVEVLNLPWLTQLELMAGGLILDLLLKDANDSNTNPPGYLLLLAATEEGVALGCLVLGLDGGEDECKGNTSFDMENMAAPDNDVLAIATKAESEAGNCTLGGVGTGLIEGEGLVLLTGADAGKTLAVS